MALIATIKKDNCEIALVVANKWQEKEIGIQIMN
jgi:hypothetical protein